MPVVMAPALMVLFWADLKAKHNGIASGLTRAHMHEKKTVWQHTKDFCIAVDAFGLLLLGFSWSLALLPFTLKSSAVGGYKNRRHLRCFDCVRLGVLIKSAWGDSVVDRDVCHWGFSVLCVRRV